MKAPDPRLPKGLAVPLLAYVRLRPSSFPATRSLSPSPSVSPHAPENVLSRSLVMSKPGPTPSQIPSPSVSVPSLAGSLSDRGPKLSVPTVQSSQLSESVSPQTSGLSGAGSEPSTTPSLSSSVSRQSDRKSVVE